MGAGFADDDGEFAFVLDALGIFWEDDGFAGADDGGRRLEEDHRLFGDFVAEFGGVGGVVAADADDFGGSDGRDEFYVGEWIGGRATMECGPWRGREFANFDRLRSGRILLRQIRVLEQTERSGCGRNRQIFIRDGWSATRVVARHMRFARSPDQSQRSRKAWRESYTPRNQE